MDFKKVLEIKQLLNEVNFGENGIIQLNGEDVKNEHFRNYDRSNCIKDVCADCNDSCNKPKCNNCKKNCNKEECNQCNGNCKDSNCPHCKKGCNDSNKKTYQLRNIAHGSHTLDYICAQYGCTSLDDCKQYINGWNDIPVLFLLENPSIDYGIYCTLGDKRPANKWYWIIDGTSYSNEKDFTYPKQLKQGKYGEMFYSLIKMFKLGNAYVTDIVKCGMNGAGGNGFLSTSCYSKECIKKCIEKHLKSEIAALTNDNKKLIIFAFGQQVYNLITAAFSSNIFGDLKDIKPTICLMPHPANRLANDYRKYVLFGKVYKALNQNEIDCQSALDNFLKNDPFTTSSVHFNKTKNVLITEISNIKNSISNVIEIEKDKKLCYSNDCLAYKIWETEKIFDEEQTFVYKIEFRINYNDMKIYFRFNTEDGYFIWDTTNSRDINENELKSINETIYKIYKQIQQIIEG